MLILKCLDEQKEISLQGTDLQLEETSRQYQTLLHNQKTIISQMMKISENKEEINQKQAWKKDSMPNFEF